MTAEDDAVSVQATLNVEQPASLILSPDPSTIAPNDSQIYAITYADADGNGIGPDKEATLGIAPDGSCAGYTCTADMIGTHTVIATDGTLAGQATLNVSHGWGPVKALSSPSGGAISSVSCSDATDCTAVGGSKTEPTYATETHGAWGPVTQLPSPSGGAFSSVSCSDATDCTAVGGGTSVPYYATETRAPWAQSLPFPAALASML